MSMEFKKIEALKIPIPISKEMELDSTEELSLEEIREQALREKEKILESAHAEARIIKENAQKDGYEDGYEQGISTAKEQLKQFENQISSEYQMLVQKLYDNQEILINNASREVLEVALFITSKLVGDLITQKEDLVIDLYKLLVPTITDKNITEIIVNPDELQLVQEYIKHINKSHQIGVVPDGDIIKGSIKVATEQGSIIYDLNQQMQEIIKELRKINA